MNENMKRMADMATLTLLGPTPIEWVDTENPLVTIAIKVPSRVKNYLEKFHKEFPEGKESEFFNLLFSDLIILGLKAEAKRLVKEGVMDLLVGNTDQQSGMPNIPDFM